MSLCLYELRLCESYHIVEVDSSEIFIFEEFLSLHQDIF